MLSMDDEDENEARRGSRVYCGCGRAKLISCTSCFKLGTDS